MKNKKRLVILLCMSFVVLFCLISFFSATPSCNSNQLSINFTFSNPTSPSITCTNDLNQSITLTTSGETNYFSINPTTINANSSQSININFNSNIPIGTHYGFINLNNSGIIPLVFTANAQSNGVIVYPTASVINIIQNAQKTFNIQVIVPQNYNGGILTIQSVSTNPNIDLVKLGDLSLGQVHAGQTVNLPINIGSTSYQPGTYNTEIDILATDNNGQVQLPAVSLQVVVSANLNPINNQTFIQPSCSLTTPNLNINQNYTLTCSNVNNNIQVSPDYSNYYYGITPSYSSGVFTWSFEPILLGQTNLSVHFLYQGSQVFSPFTEAINILPNGQTTPGNQLGFEFHPDLSLANDGQLITVHVLNINTSTYIDNAQVYLNGILTNGTINLNANQNYSIRAHVTSGYVDYIQNISINPKYIVINLNPATGIIANTPVNVSTNPANCSLFLDGTKVSNLIYPTSGNHTLEAIQQGYVTTDLNFSVGLAPAFITISNLTKGSLSTFILNVGNLPWQVQYMQTLSSPPQTIAAGTGETVSFTPNDNGIYHILVNNQQLWQGQINGWDGTIFGFMWYWIIIVIIIIIVVIIFIVKMSGGGGGGYMPPSMVNLGQMTSEV